MSIIPWAIINWCFSTTSLADCIVDSPVAGKATVIDSCVCGCTVLGPNMGQENIIVFSNPFAYSSSWTSSTRSDTNIGTDERLAKGHKNTGSTFRLFRITSRIHLLINDVTSNRLTARFSLYWTMYGHKGLLRRCDERGDRKGPASLVAIFRGGALNCLTCAWQFITNWTVDEARGQWCVQQTFHSTCIEMLTLTEMRAIWRGFWKNAESSIQSSRLSTTVLSSNFYFELALSIHRSSGPMNPPMILFHMFMSCGLLWPLPARR